MTITRHSRRLRSPMPLHADPSEFKKLKDPRLGPVASARAARGHPRPSRAARNRTGPLGPGSREPPWGSSVTISSPGPASRRMFSRRLGDLLAPRRGNRPSGRGPRPPAPRATADTHGRPEPAAARGCRRRSGRRCGRAGSPRAGGPPRRRGTTASGRGAAPRQKSGDGARHEPARRHAAERAGRLARVRPGKNHVPAGCPRPDSMLQLIAIAPSPRSLVTAGAIARRGLQRRPRHARREPCLLAPAPRRALSVEGSPVMA